MATKTRIVRIGNSQGFRVAKGAARSGAIARGGRALRRARPAAGSSRSESLGLVGLPQLEVDAHRRNRPAPRQTHSDSVRRKGMAVVARAKVARGDVHLVRLDPTRRQRDSEDSPVRDRVPRRAQSASPDGDRGSHDHWRTGVPVAGSMPVSGAIRLRGTGSTSDGRISSAS